MKLLEISMNVYLIEDLYALFECNKLEMK